MTNSVSSSIGRTFPLLGVLLSTVILAVAAARYPGGYDWLSQSVSSLFQPNARNGSPNASRFLAVVAVLTFSSSIAIIFNTIAKSIPAGFHRKTIRIAGIGSMVYAALVVTPMHDVLVSVALVFFVTAMITIFHRLYLERSFAMLGAGVACLALTLCNAVTYYGQVLYGFLPIVQKVSIVLWASWLYGLSLRGFRTATSAGQT
ncbi:MAG: hypothetical protein ACT4OZ_12490 [Gemmatimonadota bacterium]